MTTAFQSGAFQDNAFQIDAATGISGVIAWTEDNDTAALTGTLIVQGAISWTEANDTAVLTGTVIVQGALSWTEADDTYVITGTVASTISGTIAWTEADDTASLSGTLVVQGSISWTEADDTYVLTGTVSGGVISGTVSWTEDDDRWLLVGVSSGALDTHDGWKKPKKPREWKDDRPALRKAILEAIDGPQAAEAVEVIAEYIKPTKSAYTPLATRIDWTALYRQADQVMAAIERLQDEEDHDIFMMML